MAWFAPTLDNVRGGFYRTARFGGGFGDGGFENGVWQGYVGLGTKIREMEFGRGDGDWGRWGLI